MKTDDLVENVPPQGDEQRDRVGDDKDDRGTTDQEAWYEEEDSWETLAYNTLSMIEMNDQGDQEDKSTMGRELQQWDEDDIFRGKEDPKGSKDDMEEDLGHLGHLTPRRAPQSIPQTQPPAGILDNIQQCPDTHQRGEGVELNVPDQGASTISYTGDSLTEKGRGPLTTGHRGESTSNPLSHVGTFDEMPPEEAALLMLSEPNRSIFWDFFASIPLTAFLPREKNQLCLP